MLTHVVLFKLKVRSVENIVDVVSRLAPLAEKIPEVRSLEVGADVINSPRSYDVALIVKFDDIDAMQAYQVHPDHVPVAIYLREVCETIIAVDFEDEIADWSNTKRKIRPIKIRPNPPNPRHPRCQPNQLVHENILSAYN